MDGRSFAPALLAKAEEPPVPRTTTMLVEFFSLSNGSPDTPPCAPDASAAAESAEDAEGSVAAAGLCYDTHASHSDWVSSALRCQSHWSCTDSLVCGQSNNTFIALRIINASHDMT